MRCEHVSVNQLIGCTCKSEALYEASRVISVGIEPRSTFAGNGNCTEDIRRRLLRD